MVVHSNDTGDNGIARTLNSLRALRDLGGRLRADELYFPVRDHNGLFFLRRRARSIDKYLARPTYENRQEARIVP
jgi:hypothetical protein